MNRAVPLTAAQIVVLERAGFRVLSDARAWDEDKGHEIPVSRALGIVERRTDAHATPAGRAVRP